jgi:ribosome-binding factor A
MHQKDEKLKEIIRELAADYFSKESNRLSLITVTGVDIYSHGSRADILITVLPENKEADALAFAKRQLSEFRIYVHDKSRIARIPFFDVKIDKGEKNRQHMDEIAKTI